MAYKQVLALWRAKSGDLYFRIDDRVKEAIAAAPNGTRVFISANKYKKTENHPDYTGYYTELQADRATSQPTQGATIDLF